jgi:hypothetical protein
MVDNNLDVAITLVVTRLMETKPSYCRQPVTLG